MPVPSPDMITGCVGRGGRYMTDGLTSTVILDPGFKPTRYRVHWPTWNQNRCKRLAY
jgi:hypothetical protein